MFPWCVTEAFEDRCVDCIAHFNALVSFQVYRETRYQGVRTHFFKENHSLIILNDKQVETVLALLRRYGIKSQKYSNTV